MFINYFLREINICICVEDITGLNLLPYLCRLGCIGVVYHCHKLGMDLSWLFFFNTEVVKILLIESTDMSKKGILIHKGNEGRCELRKFSDFLYSSEK